MSIQDVHDQIELRAREIATFFARPDEARITIIVRTPWVPDGGVLVSNDDLEQAADELSRLAARPPAAQTGGLEPAASEPQDAGSSGATPTPKD